MSRARRRLAFVASLILLVSPALAQTPENDFSLYPSSARPCLLDASDRSKCKGDDVPSNNRCLCSNGGDFVTNAATCIGTDAPDTLLTVYTTMRTACSDSGTEGEQHGRDGHDDEELALCHGLDDDDNNNNGRQQRKQRPL
ncbi:Calnexin-like protein [Verticillium dahliae VDG1]|nr:Calnexin-like protein [Verticillium dahliae VDG1]